MHDMVSRAKAPHAASRQEPLTLTKPPWPTRGFSSVLRYVAPPAASEVTDASGRSPDAVSPASAEAHFGHDFSRMRIYPDERADTQPGGVGGREPVAFAAQEPVLPRLRVKNFAAKSPQPHHLASPQPDSAARPDKSIAELSEFQDQSTSLTTFKKTAAGVRIMVEANDVAPTGKHPDGFKFTQTIDTNVPAGGASSPYVDPRPNDDAKPFYWTDAEQAAHPTTFRDAPARPAPAAGTTNWDATLALNGVNEATKTVTAYDALTYGFSRDNAGTVTTRQPKSTSTGAHRSILASEFPGWTFNWGFTGGEKAAIGLLGGAAAGAVVGALAGGPVGALVGAGIGALAGGLGSLLF
jgi:hypothetical protein